MDQSLLDELPSCVEIHHPRYRNLWKLIPHDIKKYLHNPLPDKYRGWVNAAEGNLIKLIKDSGAQAIIKYFTFSLCSASGAYRKRKNVNLLDCRFQGSLVGT